MQLFDNIRYCFKQLNEFSDSRKDAIADLRGLAKPYTTHICKLILWGNQSIDWQNDWIDEIYSYIEQVGYIRIKSKTGMLKPQDYLTSFFFKYFEDLSEFKTRLTQTKNSFQFKGYPVPNTVDIETVYNLYVQLCYNLVKLIQPNLIDYEKVTTHLKQFVSQIGECNV